MSGGQVSRVWTIARRELKALFDHPTGYILLVAFVAANSFLFFRQAFVTGQASLRPMLDLLPWLFLFFVPAVSMRVIAEETRTGTLELVLTNPLTDLELLAGKYFGVLLFLFIGLTLTAPIPMGLWLGADLQWGPVIAQYVGTTLLAMGMSAVGVWASTVARSQITAFILAVSVSFVLVLVGLDPLIVGLGPTAGAIVARLGVLSHFESIARGVIDLRDAVYFVSLAGIFLAFAYGSLVRRRLAPAGATARRLRLGVAVMAAALLVINLAGGYIGGRLDLTPGKLYTLSKASSDIVAGLDDIVTVRVYATDELPTDAALLKREMDDLLRDLRTASHGKLRIVRRDPGESTATEVEAQQLGIEPVQFNVVDRGGLQVKQGYLGLAIQYGARQEAIPFVDRIDDLEYRLATAIRNLARPEKRVIGVVQGPPDQYSPAGGLAGVEEELSRSYELRGIMLSDSTQPAADVSTLILIGTMDQIPADAVDRFHEFFRRGGSALVLAGGMQISSQQPIALPRPVAWNRILRPFGVTIASDMVYDLVSNQPIPIQGDAGTEFLRQYPLFVRAIGTGQSVVNAGIPNVLTPWPSSVETSTSQAWEYTPLLLTTRAGGSIKEPADILPTAEFPQTGLATRLLAVQVAPRSDSVRGRAIVVGSAHVVVSSFGGSGSPNGTFVLNAVDWLSQDESLISIRSKDTQPPTLAYPFASLREGVKYVNMIGIPALVALVGLVRLARRGRRTRKPYAPLVARRSEASA